MDNIKEFFEHLIVDVQQISAHVYGINEITHYTRTCLLCQPIHAKMQFPTPINSILPPTFPSDLEYEIAKLKTYDRSIIPSGKQLILINEEEYNQCSKTKRPSWIKEIILFLHTLGYTTFNPMPLYLSHTKLAITNASKLKKKHEIDEEKKLKSKQEKFIFLCWGEFDNSLLQKILLVCNPIACQIVLWIIDKPEEERKNFINNNISKQELEDKTDHIFGIQFSSINALRRFHCMLLQREGRVTIENVINYALTDQYMNIFVHNKNKDKMEQQKNLSFIY